MESTIMPIGEWAPIYAERLHFLDGLVPPGDWADPTSDRGARLAAFVMAPFGEPEPTDTQCRDRDIPGPHGPVRVRIYRPATGATSGAGLSGCTEVPTSPETWRCPRRIRPPGVW